MTALGLLSVRDLLPAWVLAAWFGMVVLLPLLLLVAGTIRRLGKVRRVPELSPMPPHMIPADLARFGQPWLGRLGFLGHQVIQILRPAGEDAPDTVTWVLPSAKERTLALLTGTLPPGGGRPGFALRLMSFLADGRVIVTADHHVTHRRPGHWALAQWSFPTIEAQVQAHRAQVEAMAGGVAATMPAAAEIPARIAAEELAVNEALVKYGDYRTSGEREIRPALFRAPAMALRDILARIAGVRAMSPTKKDVASARRDATPGEEELSPSGGGFKLSLEEQVEQDIRRYRKHADEPAGMKQVGLRVALLVATVLGFTAVFGRENLAMTVGMLLGLIAVHEFGHWVMMRLFGYQRMGRFFVPFVGPLDRGRKLHAPPWQQLMVILAGPLPGMLFGLGVLVAGFLVPDLPVWLRDLGGLALALNAFHLLPFLPLDGGKAVDLLIFRDLPILRPLFTIVSASATLIASFPLKSRALRIVAIGMFTGLAWDFKMIKVVRGGRRLGWAGTVDDEKEALQRIFRGVREENNEAFLRSNDWQRQIDVLVAEVLRKRPGFLFRIFGGGFYWWSLMIPVGVILMLFVTRFVGSAGQMNSLAKHVIEISQAFPADNRPLTEPQYNAVAGLVTDTSEIIDETEGSPRELAALLTPEVGVALDKLDWTAAGIALHCEEIEGELLSVWLECLCGKLENAVRNGNHTEGLRRGEVLLHGLLALEPVRHLRHREPIWDCELRTLTAVEQLAASGKLDAATIQRLEARVNALNKAPRPEVESLILATGWGLRQAETLLVDANPNDDHEPMFDARFWRLATPQTLRLFDNVKAFGTSTPATVTVAQHWRKTGRVGEIPAQVEGGAKVYPAPGEAEFIAEFCEKHRKVAWRRLTTLSALRLEDYRLKSGKLPDQWKHSLPGGASLTLEKAAGPCLKLVDARNASQRSVPDWLGPLESAAQTEHVCPLNGAPPELSRK